MKRKIAAVLTDRCNYGRMKPILQKIKNHPDLELQIICTGTMVLERFGKPMDICINDGFKIDAEIHAEIEGSVPTSMAKSIGLTMMETANIFNILKPDFLLVIGDRYEALGVVITACYMNICVTHVQGGEVSGTMDESARHAISKFAHYHFPSTQRAYEYLIRMGEDPNTVFKTGCPVSDIAHELDKQFHENPFLRRGIGGPLKHNEPYLLVIFHPDTCQQGKETKEVEQLANAIIEIKMPTCWLWANIDSGGDHINKYLRAIHEYQRYEWLQFIKNFPPETYQKILANAACAVGNSSSFVRDSTFYGTPVVLVGERQKGRETGHNSIMVETNKDEILNGIKRQLLHGPFEPDHLYGDGNASKQIVEHLLEISKYTQKKLYYINE